MVSGPGVLLYLPPCVLLTRGLRLGIQRPAGIQQMPSECAGVHLVHRGTPHILCTPVAHREDRFMDGLSTGSSSVKTRRAARTSVLGYARCVIALFPSYGYNRFSGISDLLLRLLNPHLFTGCQTGPIIHDLRPVA